MQYACKYHSPLGKITMAGEENYITGLWFDGQKYFADTLSPSYVYDEKRLPVFDRAKEWLDCYFTGKQPAFTPPLRLSGTPFRLMVWALLQEIPYGKTVTYKDIAEKIAARIGRTRMSAQAVGGAVAHNPVSIIVPCHRVVGSNGSLTGYAGGISKKIELLTLEKADIATLFVPASGSTL